MPHLFLNNDNFAGNAEFQTQNAILITTPYEPKVLIVGTYNDGNNATNQADFFYGRNYFWTVFENFSHNHQVGDNNFLRRRRIAPAQVAFADPNPPTLHRILELCYLFELAFADLIMDIQIPLTNHEDERLNGAVALRQTINNAENIIRFINTTTSIEHVYLTTALQGYAHLHGIWDTIVQNSRPGVTFKKILTPSGRGNIPAIPHQISVTQKIARYWAWVNNPASPNGVVTNPNFNSLDDQWLREAGVNLNLY